MHCCISFHSVSGAALTLRRVTTAVARNSPLCGEGEVYLLYRDLPQTQRPTSPQQDPSFLSETSVHRPSSFLVSNSSRRIGGCNKTRQTVGGGETSQRLSTTLFRTNSLPPHRIIAAPIRAFCTTILACTLPNTACCSRLALFTTSITAIRCPLYRARDSIAAYCCRDIGGLASLAGRKSRTQRWT